MAENLQSAAVIAKIFGVTTRRIEQLKAEGIIKGQGRPTKYDLLPTIQAYIRYLSDRKSRQQQSWRRQNCGRRLTSSRPRPRQRRWN